MKNQFILLWECIIGPKLYQTYPLIFSSSIRQDQQPNHIYTKNTIEALSDNIFFVFKIFSGLFQIIWPFCLIYIYYKGLLIFENVFLLLRLIICIIILLIYFILLRGIGRFINPIYKIFINEFYRVKIISTDEIRQKFLSKFDFSLSHWKSDYTIDASAVRKIPLISTNHDNLIFIERLFDYLLLVLGYICVNIFGRRLMFPGSLQIIRFMMNRSLLDGRTNLIVSYHGKRCILNTANGNHIDTMFIDRRSTDHGQILIITCEGNAGFYEIGCMMTPIEAGYSVLGWNRPGFGESSGSSSVLSEINSIDAVMHYAIEKLHFPIHNIVIFAWSIGGYAACWTAVHYQNIQGLILDAIFDDIVPLAQRQMPLLLSKFVEKTVRYYLNLNNVELLKLYNGSFYLIRRTKDEIMNFSQGKFETNRANNILLSILPYRYPFIYNHNEIFLLFKQFISSNKLEKNLLRDKYCSDKDQLQLETYNYRLNYPISSYPCKFGENFSFEQRKSFAIYLIDQYLINFNSQHSTSLPQNYFFIPNRCV